MLNACHFIGRIATDPEVRKITGKDGKESSVARFTLAISRPYNKNVEKQEADWIRCVAWSSTADFIQRNFPKGRLAEVDASVRTHVYENQDNNTKQTITEFFVNSIEGLSAKTTSETTEAPTTKAEPQAPIALTEDSELPF